MSMYLIGTYSHNGNIGVLVELKYLSDANTEKADLKLLAEDIAMHVAASNPADVQELLSQWFVKNPDQSVSQLLNAKSLDFGDTLSISRFIRWEHKAEEDVEGPDDDPAAAFQLKRA